MVALNLKRCYAQVILVRGKSASVRKLADSLIATKNVKHGRFMLTTSGHDLP